MMIKNKFLNMMQSASHIRPNKIVYRLMILKNDSVEEMKQLCY